jgi:hypothetical protein
LDTNDCLVLGAVDDLSLRSCDASSLAALSACTQLTRLEHDSLDDMFDGDAAPPRDPHLYSEPRRTGLRCRKLSTCDSSTMAWVEQLQGVHRLYLAATQQPPALFRCAVNLQ